MEFNVQTFLSEMKRDQQEHNREVTAKLDMIVTRIGEHETRIVGVEKVVKNIRWVLITIVGGAISSVFGWFKH